MKVVIDCNVIMSAGKNEGTCYQLVNEVMESHTCFVSPEIIIEYLDLDKREHLKEHHQKIREITKKLLRFAERIEATPHDFRLKHASDEIYLGVATAAHADILITGNIKHFPQPYYGSIRILKPREFLDLYGK